jgi:hypothetical protein
VRTCVRVSALQYVYDDCSQVTSRAGKADARRTAEAALLKGVLPQTHGHTHTHTHTYTHSHSRTHLHTPHTHTPTDATQTYAATGSKPVEQKAPKGSLLTPEQSSGRLTGALQVWERGRIHVKKDIHTRMHTYIHTYIHT